MGYITKERVSEIRETLKKEFPKTKFSITRENYSGVKIAIMESDIDFNEKYRQVNNYHLSSNYSGDQLMMLEKINQVANDGVSFHETGDYGSQPSHYVWISIGKWDKDFKPTKK